VKNEYQNNGLVMVLAVILAIIALFAFLAGLVVLAMIVMTGPLYVSIQETIITNSVQDKERNTMNMFVDRQKNSI
jgi:cell division septal protein FtsQ